MRRERQRTHVDERMRTKKNLAPSPCPSSVSRFSPLAVHLCLFVSTKCAQPPRYFFFLKISSHFSLPVPWIPLREPDRTENRRCREKRTTKDGLLAPNGLFRPTSLGFVFCVLFSLSYTNPSIPPPSSSFSLRSIASIPFLHQTSSFVRSPILCLCHSLSSVLPVSIHPF